MGEFTVGKEADDYYDNKNDDKVFHNLCLSGFFFAFHGKKSGRKPFKKIFDNFCELCWFVKITWMTGTLNNVSIKPMGFPNFSSNALISIISYQ